MSTQPIPTFTLLPTLTPAPTLTAAPQPTATLFPSPTFPPPPTATPTWVTIPAGQKVTAPILMYHHVTNLDPGARYNVTIDNFRTQMEVLRANGFTPITTVELANVLWYGGLLPPRPIVITFDDGNQDVYDNAFPILKEYGFKAVMYVVADRLESDNFLHVDRLKELIANGWEIGSHTMTHANLSDPPLGLGTEMYGSRTLLSSELGVDVLTLAYPYTVADIRVFRHVGPYGYLAAVSAGPFNEQSLGNVYCLYRREVEGSMTLADFSRLLGLPAQP